MPVQCRLQLGNRNSNFQYSGPRQCVQHLLRTEGLRGLTRGMPATIAREAPGNAIFFTVYEVSHVHSNHSLEKLALTATVISTYNDCVDHFDICPHIKLSLHMSTTAVGML